MPDPADSGRRLTIRVAIGGIKDQEMIIPPRMHIDLPGGGDELLVPEDVVQIDRPAWPPGAKKPAHDFSHYLHLGRSAARMIAKDPLRRHRDPITDRQLVKAEFPLGDIGVRRVGGRRDQRDLFAGGAGQPLQKTAVNPVVAVLMVMITGKVIPKSPSVKHHLSLIVMLYSLV